MSVILAPSDCNANFLCLAHKAFPPILRARTFTSLFLPGAIAQITRSNVQKCLTKNRRIRIQQTQSVKFITEGCLVCGK